MVHNRQIRRVNLSLHLSPEQSRADLRAMQQLKKWHEDVQQSGDNVSDANMEIRRFHRNVYLAGLQLYLLKPQLCNHIAESLGREAFTLNALCSELQSDGLLSGEAADIAAPDTFSERQLEQMRVLMTQTLQKQSTHDDPTMLHDEILNLKRLLEQQNLLLQQTRVSESAAVSEPVKKHVAEEVDLNSVAAPMQKMNKVRQKGVF